MNDTILSGRRCQISAFPGSTRTLAAVTQDPALLHDPEQAENAESEAADLIVRAVVRGRVDDTNHPSVRRRRLVEHAVRLARNDAQNIKSVAELSQESSASIRTLRRGFPQIPQMDADRLPDPR